jgi:hypothetical protein
MKGNYFNDILMYLGLKSAIKGHFFCLSFRFVTVGATCGQVVIKKCAILNVSFENGTFKMTQKRIQ